MRRNVRVVGLVATALLIVSSAACSGESGDDASVAMTVDEGGGLADSAEGGELDLDRVARSERAVIHTADLTVRTKEVEQAADQANTIVSDAGGFVDSQEADFDGAPSVHLVLKVPPDRFDATLESLEELGTVSARTIRTDDVTQQVVDLDARIESAGTSVGRLRELLEGQGTLDDIVTLERELAQREADLESLRAVRAALSEQIDLATITLRLSRPAKTASDGEPSEKIPGFLRGLKTGWGAFVNVILGLITVAGFALPFAAAGGVLFVLLRPFARRRRSRRLPADGDPERHRAWPETPDPAAPDDHGE